MQSHRFFAGDREHQRSVPDALHRNEIPLAVDRIRQSACPRRRSGELRKSALDGRGIRRIAHEQLAVVAQQLHGTSVPERDRSIESRKILEAHDGCNDTGERAGLVLQPARQDDSRTPVGAGNYRLAHEQSGPRAVALRNEVGAVRHVHILGR